MAAQIVAGDAGLSGLPLWPGEPRKAHGDAVFAKFRFVAAVAIARKLELPAPAPEFHPVGTGAADLGGDPVARDLHLPDGARLEVIFPLAKLRVARQLPQERAVEKVVGWGRRHGQDVLPIQ